MALALFIPIMLMLLIAVYVISFKDEFDKENLSAVGIVVGAILVLLFIWAILTTLGSSVRT